MPTGFRWMLLIGALAIATPAVADDAADDAQDEAFTVAVKDFGYTGGAAWQCGDAEARLKIERQALRSFNGLSQLFGTDEAFFFSAAFGAGTVDEIDKAKCADFVKRFEEGVSKGGMQ